MQYEKINDHDLAIIKDFLYDYSSLLYKSLELYGFYYSDSIPTACVTLNKESGTPLFLLVNKSFWAGLNIDQKKFIILHEMFHVFLSHTFRLKDLHIMMSNYAMDIVINHTISTYYGLSRSIIDPNNEYCWIDTVFVDSTNILVHQSFEYYYAKLMDNTPPENIKLLGSHASETNGDGEIYEYREILDYIKEHFSGDSDMKGQISKFERESNGSPERILDVTKEKVKVKQKWESVIKKWVSSKIRISENSIDTWVGRDRRLALIDDSILLPATMELEKRNKEKIHVLFMQDTSGSCVEYAKRFFKAAQSIPSNKIEVSIVCFDTLVYPTSLENPQIRGGGGNNSYCMEQYIQKLVKGGAKYPDAVFLMSDGYVFGPVEAEYPERWYWFMPEDNTKSYLHPKMHRFKLADYE